VHVLLDQGDRHAGLLQRAHDLEDSADEQRHRPSEGSSKMMILGSVMTPRAIDSMDRLPLGCVPAYWARRLLSLGNRRRSRRKRSAPTETIRVPATKNDRGGAAMRDGRLSNGVIGAVSRVAGAAATRPADDVLARRAVLGGAVAAAVGLHSTRQAMASEPSQGPVAAGEGPSAKPSGSSLRHASFVAGRNGPWRIDRIDQVVGEGLPSASRLSIIEGSGASAAIGDAWLLRGTTSNTRYTSTAEAIAMAAVQEDLGRPGKTRAALIPLRKRKAWWALSQEERLAIFGRKSRHTNIGMEYLPMVSRRLYHGRDLGEEFDFLTWFEYAPEDSDAFEALVKRLRETSEWGYVDREVDVRLSREAPV
jgi:hypothetical protein